MFRFFLLSGVALGALVAREAAAQPLGAPATDWSGFYAGATLGAGVNTHRWSDFTANPAFDGTTRSFSSTGVVFGAFIGHNWQVSPTFVVGIESDLTYNTGSSFTRWPAASAIGIESRGGLLWTARARAGLSVDRLLLYVTGGLAVGNTNTRDAHSVTPALAPNWNFNRTRVGFVIGAGAEYMVTRNWTLRVEALHTEFGTQSLGAAGLNGIAAGKVLRVKSSQTQVRAGLAYRF